VQSVRAAISSGVPSDDGPGVVGLHAAAALALASARRVVPCCWWFAHSLVRVHTEWRASAGAARHTRCDAGVLFCLRVTGGAVAACARAMCVSVRAAE
jgi:hypothetical protein